MIPSAVFVAAVALQNKFPLSSKFSINLGSLPKTYMFCRPGESIYMAGFLVKRFGGCLWEYSVMLTGASCWPSSNYILVQKIVSLSTELNHNRSASCWTLTMVCAVTTPLHSLCQGLRTAGKIRPAKLFHPAPKHILPIIKNNIFTRNVLI